MRATILLLVMSVLKADSAGGVTGVWRGLPVPPEVPEPMPGPGKALLVRDGMERKSNQMSREE